MVCHNREQFVNFIFHTVFNTHNLVLAGGKIYQPSESKYGQKNIHKKSTNK